jgi:hypothetical protein
MCFECDGNEASISSEFRTAGLCLAIVIMLILFCVGYRLYRVYAARGERTDAGVMRWVKPSFSAGGAAPLAIYTKVRFFGCCAKPGILIGCNDGICCVST